MIQSPMFMKLNRDHVLVTDSGISIGFKKGEPVPVPVRFMSAAIMIGAEACDDQAAAKMESIKADRDEATAEAADRLKKVEAGVIALVERNMPGDFTAGGKPNMKQLEKLIGFDATRDEVDHIFLKVKADLRS